MFKVTATESHQIVVNIVKDIARENFRIVSYREGRDYAILKLRQMEREALERGDNMRQSAYCEVLWETFTNKL